jgi:SAM-dependent methyltransferase
MGGFFKSLGWFLAFPFLCLKAEIRLDRLVEYDQETCSEILQAAELSDLWNYFLKGQANLYFNQEADWLSQQDGWIEARAVLELGSGNGAYLARLLDMFGEKTYVGVEKQPAFVEQSNVQFGRAGLTFVEGDAEVEREEYKGQFDAVLYRLTLQHLKNPKSSLVLAHEYLKQGGHVIIIDSYDPAKISSHVIRSFDDASRQHNEKNRSTLKGNRHITMEILRELENGPLRELYEVANTSLDGMGNRLEKGVRFESEQDRKQYFNHALLFLAILKKGYEVSVDLEEAYSELQVYLSDDQSWICPGLHLLVLKKR